jgi:tungstate transport system ATP-binding protein
MIFELERLRKTYGERTVLDIDALVVHQGEILALVGPSGAGKSTLLRLLNFLETPTAGLIRYDGLEVVGAPPLALRRQITTVFQRPLLQRASVRENVEYGLRLRNLRPGSVVDAILEEVGLAAFAKQPARQLSGGEMQRVALARALVIKPRVLLLDEPTANLDPYNVGLIEDIIRRQNTDRGTTVVLVTHNIFQAKRLAHRTGLMLGGRLVELDGTPRFFASPSDERTAAFVRGDMVY